MQSGQACSLLEKHNRKQGCHLMLKCPHVLQPLWVPRWPMGLLTDLVFGYLDGAAVAMDQLPARTTPNPMMERRKGFIQPPAEASGAG